MTTDELIAGLKVRGVSHDDAEFYRTLRLKGTPGRNIIMPIATDGHLIEINATITGEDEGFIPVWNSVEEHQHPDEDAEKQ